MDVNLVLRYFCVTGALHHKNADVKFGIRVKLCLNYKIYLPTRQVLRVEVDETADKKIAWWGFSVARSNFRKKKSDYVLCTNGVFVPFAIVTPENSRVC